jgi:hypothetical protein
MHYSQCKSSYSLENRLGIPPATAVQLRCNQADEACCIASHSKINQPPVLPLRLSENLSSYWDSGKTTVEVSFNAQKIQSYKNANGDLSE